MYKRQEYYLYLYSSKNLGPNIIRIRIRPKIWVRILFVFGYFENTNIIRLSIRPSIYIEQGQIKSRLPGRTLPA